MNIKKLLTVGVIMFVVATMEACGTSAQGTPAPSPSSQFSVLEDEKAPTPKESASSLSEGVEITLYSGEKMIIPKMPLTKDGIILHTGGEPQRFSIEFKGIKRGVKDGKEVDNFIFAIKNPGKVDDKDALVWLLWDTKGYKSIWIGPDGWDYRWIPVRKEELKDGISFPADTDAMGFEISAVLQGNEEWENGMHFNYNVLTQTIIEARAQLLEPAGVGQE